MKLRTEIVEYLNQQPDLRKFIREQPMWYRKLTRNPHEIQYFEISSLQYYKKTIPDRVEKFSNGVQMASMMMSMFQAMNSNLG